ncbi:hypothetical protein TNCV_2990381 [Trichonephila clavipes]|nr:hypothetical protein TNCV_2990381 [Trichonephila clavipes]
MALYGSPLTVTLWSSSFLKKGFHQPIKRTKHHEETHEIATANRIALSTRIPLPPEPEGPTQQMTASSPAILINHPPESINESGVTSTRCYPIRQEAPSPHRRQHPRTLELFMIWDGGLIYNPVPKDTQHIYHKSYKNNNFERENICIYI